MLAAVSGQLVGEVIAAVPELRSRGVTLRGFMALVAVAEHCRDIQSRQASVPWSHIQAGLFGASHRTAKRAIKELRDAGVLRIVKRGFNNQQGRIAAPQYEILTLSERDTRVAQSPQTERATQVSQSVASERATQVSQSVGPNGTNQATERDKSGNRTGHPGGLLSVTSSVTSSVTTRGTRKRALPPDWWPAPDLIEKLRNQFPNIGIEEQAEEFVLYVLKNGKKYVDWNAAFKSWIRKAEQFRIRDNHAHGGHPNAYEAKKAHNAQILADFQAASTGPEIPELPR